MIYCAMSVASMIRTNLGSQLILQVVLEVLVFINFKIETIVSQEICSD